MKVAEDLHRFVAPSLIKPKSKRFAPDEVIHTTFEPGLRRLDALFFAKQKSGSRAIWSFMYDARTGAASWLATKRG